MSFAHLIIVALLVCFWGSIFRAIRRLFEKKEKA